MIIALGILLPHVTKIPGVKQTLKAMISYLKKARVPAKNALLRIFKKGKKATVKLFADAEKGASHGLNIFEDLGGDFLESAGEIVDNIIEISRKVKIKASEVVKVFNNTGSIGFKKIDDISKSISKIADDVVEWIGKDAKFIKKDSGDLVLLSKDGNKRFRLDINRTSPHDFPHGHVEEYIDGDWIKSGPIATKKE